MSTNRTTLLHPLDWCNISRLRLSMISLLPRHLNLLIIVRHVFNKPIIRRRACHGVRQLRSSTLLFVPSRFVLDLFVPFFSRWYSRSADMLFDEVQPRAFGHPSISRQKHCLEDPFRAVLVFCLLIESRRDHVNVSVYKRTQ